MAEKSTRTKKSEPAAAAAPPELQGVPFEKALEELEHIVEELEEGSLSLEDSLTRFERGIHLSRHLERQLRDAEARVQKLVGGETDQPILAPFQEGDEEEPPLEDEEDEDEGNGGGRLF